MLLVSKVIILLIYAFTAAAVAGLLPPGPTQVLEIVTLVLMAAHAIEVVLAFKYVRRYRGPLAVSIALTLIFGLLHWRPLMRAPAADANQ